MIVIEYADDESLNFLAYGMCKECNQVNTGNDWCKSCNSKRFQQNFNNWTSGNDDIDKFIQNAQLSANNEYEILEWISYDRINYNIEYIAKGKFGKVYKAKYNHRIMDDLNDLGSNQQNESEFALEILNDLQNIIDKSEFINKVINQSII